VGGRAPVPDQEVNRLRAILVGLFAFVLASQVAAAATKAQDTTPAKPKAAAAGKHTKPLTLEQQLERSRANARKHRGTIRFFENHPRLLSRGESRAGSRARLRYAKQRLPKTELAIERIRKAIARRDARQLASLTPKQAICTVFGRYCSQAVDVAWCESRLSTTAQNGQYLGLFQMGSSERRIFGHGPSAHDQALAAHRYFVVSGRDWSPWSCRWAAS
jgi:hypothetical protein